MPYGQPQFYSETLLSEDGQGQDLLKVFPRLYGGQWKILRVVGPVDDPKACEEIGVQPHPPTPWAPKAAYVEIIRTAW